MGATLMGTSLSSGLLTLGSWAVGRGFLLGSPWAGEEEEPCAVLWGVSLPSVSLQVCQHLLP